ncbi:uncharacterized protein TNCV_3445061 [Trichonephila clavipes]|nr:uncharacterized protein TNCV_3445061 [Trichonephila clavipes]
MALKLNLKKHELISVAVEMGLVIPSKAKLIDLKKLIESSAVYKNDIEFVRSLVENALEKKKAFQIKSMPDELKAKILLNILGERVNNLLTYGRLKDQLKQIHNHSGVKTDCSAKNKYWVEVRCLLDVGSQSCLCTRACGEKLQLKMEKINTVVSCVNDSSMVVKNCVKTSVANKAKTFENSKDIAIRRLNSLWKRFSRDSRYLSLYAEFLKDYEELGYLERVVESSEPPTHYYIPHHGVLRPEKLTTKLRIFFNGSSPTTTGISLNDILLKGEVKEDVFETISRSRRHKFAFTTDIQKMYRQILINPDQQDLQRIIWKNGLDAEILTYRLKTVTYGLSNAPFLAIRTLQQLAKDEKSRFPLASETLLYDTYMDDIVSGAPDLETAQQLQSQLKDALQSCGMNLHKRSSNSPLSY